MSPGVCARSATNGASLKEIEFVGELTNAQLLCAAMRDAGEEDDGAPRSMMPSAAEAGIEARVSGSAGLDPTSDLEMPKVEPGSAEKPVRESVAMPPPPAHMRTLHPEP